MGHISLSDITLYCNTNEPLIKGGVKAVVVELPGLGGGSCLGGVMDMCVYDNAYTRDLASRGILAAYMFPGPLSWMNKAAAGYCDLVLDAIYEKYGLTDSTPLTVCGGSMGGLGALIFAADSRHRVTACAAACPCCDVPAAYAALPQFRRTILSAVTSYGTAPENAMKEISPVHRIGDMPYVPYRIVADGADELFPESGLRSFADAMISSGHDVTFVSLPGQGPRRASPTRCRNAGSHRPRPRHRSGASSARCTPASR